MKTVYAVTKSTALNDAIVICEDKADALVLAEQINYLGDEESPEDYVYEVPLVASDN